MKISIYLIIAALFLYLSACVLLYVFQREFLYFPTDKYENPYDEIQLQNQEETISVILLNEGKDHALISVSYTHLTLPTTPYV